MNVTIAAMGEGPQRISRKKLIIWAILCAIFPPVGFLLLILSILKPAIRGKVPEGINYVLWISGLIFMGSLLSLPIGSFGAIAKTLQDPQTCALVLLLDGTISIVSISLIILAFRKQGIPNPYIPIVPLHLDKTVILLGMLSFFPLLSILSSAPLPGNITHPLLMAVLTSVKANSYISLLMGLLSIGLLGPILEEMIFRGLLLETSHERARKKWVRHLLDFFVCLFFASLHLPFSFIYPFALGLVFIYVRRRTGSLVPSMIMHVSWNTSIIAALVIRGVHS